ncbi:MAG: hypothetical protein M3Z32_09655 [Acidobacteriota bacterium]|nr:hypothetical protein [Acidobacteriota bacterium]
MLADTSVTTLQTELHASTWKLPPLILHPFSDAKGPRKLIESSRASMKMRGLLPTGDYTRSELEGMLFEGRFSELRMLYYVGKDINRWAEQCLDCIRRRDAGLAPQIRAQSLVTLLIQNTPAHVREKLQKWGVADYRALFSRGLGLNLIFANAPERSALTEEFVHNYHRYSDQVFCSYQSETSHTVLDPALFHFDLFSSGEYSRMLERLWDKV